VKGLKTQEPSEFVEFMEQVQEEADKFNKTFFLECADGHEGVVNGLHVCDLFGWLIAPEQEELFVPAWEKDEIDDSWFQAYVSVTWTDRDGLKVMFN
jgi:hypothetical protein